jgi:HlyD family secretion protein
MIKKIKAKPKLVAIVIAAVLVVLGGYLLFGRDSAKEAVAQTTTAKVERGDIRLSVASNGRVVANLDVDIKCKASGEIIKLPFDISDSVKTGDLLVELDPVDEERILHQAQIGLQASQARLVVAKENLEIAERTLDAAEKRLAADLQSAKASAKDARAKADRMKQLLQQKLVSQEEYDTAETSSVQANANLTNTQVKEDDLEIQRMGLELKRQDVKLAEAEVENDTVVVTVAQDRLNDTKVISPMDGVVSARNVQKGQIIASGVSNVGGGTTVLTLSDLSHIFVLASVDESDIGKVKVGQDAIITADAYPGKTFQGKVVRIATRGVNASNVVTFEVKIEVIGEQKNLLKPEMTANIEIVAAARDDVLTVPVEALIRKERKFYSTVVNGSSNEEREVTIGITDGVKTEIASGLAEGQTVRVRRTDANSRWNADRNRGPRMMIPGGGGGRR